MNRIAILTGGGDCAGLNAFIASAVKRSVTRYGLDVIGIRNAFAGACSPDPQNYVVPFRLSEVRDLASQPSTVLASSRFAPFSPKNVENGYPQKLINNLKALRVDGVLVTGGDDTLRSSMHLAAMGVPVLAAPKGIDNDVSATDVMLGYRTAVDFGAVQCRSTAVSAETHQRISLVEVMGRQAGWLALDIGIASSADVILLPERVIDLGRVARRVDEVYREQGYCNVIVAEGTSFAADDPVIRQIAPRSRVIQAILDEETGADEHGNPMLGGIVQILKRILVIHLGLGSLSKVRTTDLGFTLRGLLPVAEDVILGTKFGIHAVDCLMQGKHGLMLAARGTEVVTVPFEDGLIQKRVNWSDDQLRSVGVCW